MNKKLFLNSLTLLEKESCEFVWASFEEIAAYIEKGYSIVNEAKRKAWKK